MDKKLCSSEGGQQPFNLLEPFKVSPTLNPFVKLTQTFPALLTCLKKGHIIDNHSLQIDIITASKRWFEYSLPSLTEILYVRKNPEYDARRRGLSGHRF